MKINLSLELTKLELEALQQGMLSNVEILREPLETIIGNDVDNILSKIPRLFQKSEHEHYTIGMSWSTVLWGVLTNKYKVGYTLEVDETLLSEMVTTSNSVLSDAVPVLNMYAQLLVTINNFRLSQLTVKSITALKSRLSIK